MSLTVRGGAVLLLVPLLAVAAGCSAPPANSAESVEFTVDGRQVVDPHQLQTEAEQQLSYALSFGLVSSAGAGAPLCWFARTGSTTQVDERLWCGPVQVPGSPPSNGWVPVPMKKVGENPGQVQLQVQAPEVPQAGNRSTPVGDRLLRTDGASLDPKIPADRTAGPNFVAVMADTEHRTNAELGLDGADAVRLHDDLLTVTGTGWGHPDSFQLPDQSTLRAAPGMGLRVLRVHVERPAKTEDAMKGQQWEGWAPQPSTVSLQVGDRRQELPAERLPDSGDVFVLYTVPDGQSSPESLVLNTVGAKSWEQRLEIPSGNRLSNDPAALRRTGQPAQEPTGEQQVKITTGHGYGDSPGGEHAAKLAVTGVRVGRQRPVKLDSGRYQMVTTSAPDKALVEVRMKVSGDKLPAITAGPLTKDSIELTLPGGERAKQVGIRYDGDLFPSAVVVEVPADTKSIKVGLRPGSVKLPALGEVALATSGDPVQLNLTF
ncbi:hypothetical protein [Kutzneria albida]|uniref:Putative secreted protein n=1 Tax=Kutzneria albida DSM 43870 TaxID=1449976 RepID=W5W0H4_9PSEU|nr:hypothetical protein [Kutzneria albida]AHH94327.1 putative secreted protein [Kutzneria albida DSM 43870]